MHCSVNDIVLLCNILVLPHFYVLSDTLPAALGRVIVTNAEDTGWTEVIKLGQTLLRRRMRITSIIMFGETNNLFLSKIIN